MKQKFKRGDLVEIIFGHPMWSKEGMEDMCPEEVGKKAIIEYSYAERYGGDSFDDYSIVWLDTGSSEAWKHESQLKLLEEGGEHLFKEAKKNRESVSKKNTDIKYILSKLEDSEISSESVLLLFKLIGYDSLFNRNGEFGILYSEWFTLHPIFVHIKNSKSLEEAKSIATNKSLEKLNIEKVYNIFKDHEN